MVCLGTSDHLDAFPVDRTGEQEVTRLLVFFESPGKEGVELFAGIDHAVLEV